MIEFVWFKLRDNHPHRCGQHTQRRVLARIQILKHTHKHTHTLFLSISLSHKYTDIFSITHSFKHIDKRIIFLSLSLSVFLSWTHTHGHTYSLALTLSHSLFHKDTQGAQKGNVDYWLLTSPFRSHTQTHKRRSVSFEVLFWSSTVTTTTSTTINQNSFLFPTFCNLNFTPPAP